MKHAGKKRFFCLLSNELESALIAMLYPLVKKLPTGQLEREVQAWQQSRNEEASTINWRFTTADACIKLKRLYPSLEPRKRSSKKNHVAKTA